MKEEGVQQNRKNMHDVYKNWNVQVYCWGYFKAQKRNLYSLVLWQGRKFDELGIMHKIWKTRIMNIWITKRNTSLVPAPQTKT